MAILFRFHPKKAVEAAAMLLKLHGKPMQQLSLWKFCLNLATAIAIVVNSVY